MQNNKCFENQPQLTVNKQFNKSFYISVFY